MSIANQLKKEYWQEGWQEGRQETLENIAISMLNQHCDTQFIANLTGLTCEQILVLQKNLEKTAESV